MKRGAEKQLTPEDAANAEKEEETKETETPGEDSSEKKETSNDEAPVKETEEKKTEEAKPPLFSFGSSASNSSSLFNFNFPSTGSSSTNQPFSFGSSQPFTFSFAGTTPFSTTGSSEEKKEEEDDDPEKDLTTNDGPVKVKTLAKEELTNGEEGEENVYTVPKMKLYELVSVKVDSKSEDEKGDSSEKKEGEKKEDAAKEPVYKKVWQERGLGVLRLNVDKKTNVARILIRREPTHQSVANFNIIHETKVSVDGVRKQVTIQTIEPVAESESDAKEEKKKDGEDEEKPKAKISFYMIRVSTKETAEELCAKISERIPKEEDKKEDK